MERGPVNMILLLRVARSPKAEGAVCGDFIMAKKLDL